MKKSIVRSTAKTNVDLDTLLIELVGGVEGNSLSISIAGTNSGKRIAGPKPWGGGHVIKAWRVNPQELIKDIKDEVACAKLTLKREAKEAKLK